VDTTPFEQDRHTHEAPSLVENYRDSGFAQRLGWGDRPVVLAVDVCVAYLEESSPLFACAHDAVASAGRVVEAARQADLPVVFTRISYEPGGANGGLFYRKVAGLLVFDEGSPLGAYPTNCAPLPGEVEVVKQYASAFFDTSLSEQLRSMGADTLVILGLSTSGCVRATAVDACSEGFIPIVVREAVGDRHPRPHEQALFDLDAKYADVVSEREVLEHFEALHPSSATP
jgi:nicotinamidase-related amidase